MKRILSLLLVSFLVVGCAGFKINPVAQDIIAYNLGIEFALQKPELIPTATAFCDAVLESDDQEFIGQALTEGVGYLAEELKHPRAKANIKRLLKNIKLEVDAGNQLDIAAIRAAVESFRDGMRL